MKYILILLTLAACNQAPKTDPATAKILHIDSLKKAQKRTQEKTVVLYPFVADRNDWRVGAAFKNTQDTVLSDTMTHIVWYNVAVTYKQFDSTGKPLFDKYGLQKDTTQWLEFGEKSILYDYKRDWNEFIPKQPGR